jgi:hypothetical protein
MDSHNALQQLLKAPFRILDPGTGQAINVDRDFMFVPLTASASSETRYLQHPAKSGLEVVLWLMTAGGGTITVTDSDGASTFNGSATSLTFVTAGDWVKLISVPSSTSAYRWQVLNGYGAGNVTGAASVTTLTASSHGTFVNYVTVAGATSGGMKLLPAGTSGYTLILANAAIATADRTLTFPDPGGADSVVYLALAQTLVAKTLTAPVINGATSASGNFDLSGSSGTFLTPTGAGTYAGRATFSKSVLRPCLAAVTALGSAAAALTADKDIILLLSVTTATTYGWTLPTGVAGMVLTLVNTAAYANTLIPASGGTINGQGANAGCQIAASKCYIAVCTATDTWHVMEAAKATNA